MEKSRQGACDPRWAREVRAAARWWADQIIQRIALRQAAPTKRDLADSIGILAAERLWSEPIPTGEQVACFESALAREIDRWFRETPVVWNPADPWADTPGPDRLVATDYRPDAVLSAAAAAAGVDAEWFPPKAWMRIDPGLVEVSATYGGPAQLIRLPGPFHCETYPALVATGSDVHLIFRDDRTWGLVTAATDAAETVEALNLLAEIRAWAATEAPWSALTGIGARYRAEQDG